MGKIILFQIIGILFGAAALASVYSGFGFITTLSFCLAAIVSFVLVLVLIRDLPQAKAKNDAGPGAEPDTSEAK